MFIRSSGSYSIEMRYTPLTMEMITVDKRGQFAGGCGNDFRFITSETVQELFNIGQRLNLWWFKLPAGQSSGSDLIAFGWTD